MLAFAGGAARLHGFALNRGATAATLDVGLRIGPGGGRLLLDDGIASWLSLDQVPWRTLSNELRRMVLESTLAPLLQWLQACLGDVTTVEETPAPGGEPERDRLPMLGFTLEPVSTAHADRAAPPTAMHGRLVLDDAGWARFAPTAAVDPPGPVSARLARLPLVLRIMLTDAWLTRAELEQTRPGDLIRLPPEDARGGTARRATLRLGSTDVHGCRLDPGRLTIQNTWPQAGRSTMTPHDASVKRLDQLEVQVGFQLGALTLSLEQLRTIGPGHTFTTHLPIEQPTVAITVDGQKVGTGRLLAVGDLVGVQVVDWV